MEWSQVLEKLLDHGLKEEHMFASTVLECMTVYLNTKLYSVADPDNTLGKHNDCNKLLGGGSVEVDCVLEEIIKVTDKCGSGNIQETKIVTNNTDVSEEKSGLMDEVEDLYGVVSPTQLHIKEEKSEEGEILEDIPLVSKDIKSENIKNIGNKHTHKRSTKKIPRPEVNTGVRTRMVEAARKPEKNNEMKEIRPEIKSDYIDDTKCIDKRNETFVGGDLEEAPSGENNVKDNTDGAEFVKEEQLLLAKLESKTLDNNQEYKVSQNIHRRTKKPNTFIPLSQADYNCGYCEFSVKNVALSGLYYRSKLRRHRQKIHNVCVICRDKFECSSDLKGHMNFVHKDEKRQTICGIEGCLFGEKGEGIGKIFPHVRYKHDKIRYICTECNQTYTHKSQHLLQHSLPPKVVEDTKPICKKCGIELASQKLMFEHYSLVHNQKLFCDSCQYQTQCDTNAVLNLIVHKKIHRQGTLICDTCSFRTLSRFTMRKHLAREHKQGNLFQCSICGYTAVIQFRLDEHMSRHTSEKLHVCDICDFKATVKNDLKRHIQRHEENPKYLCDQCDYKTWDSANFVTHKKVKHGSDIHKCIDCEYETRSLRSLRLHKFKHGPPMNCLQCKFETKSIRALKQHKYKHKP